MMFPLFKTKLEYYKSIDDLPVFNWFKIQETNDLKYLLIKPVKCTKSQLSLLKETLHEITNEYIDTFGISDNYKSILELKREIRIKEIDFILTKQRINKTFINVLKSKLKAALENNKSVDPSSVWVHARKYMNGNLDMKTTSVREFYSILNELKREAELQVKNERPN